MKKDVIILILFCIGFFLTPSGGVLTAVGLLSMLGALALIYSQPKIKEL